MVESVCMSTCSTQSVSVGYLCYRMEWRVVSRVAL